MQEQSLPTIRPHDFCSMPGGCYVLDVRTLPEYREVRLRKGIVHIPLDELDGAKIAAAFPDRSKPIFIMCKSGKRAAMAAQKLKGVGIANTVVIDGGIDGCIAYGADVIRGQGISLERQVRMAAGALVMAGVALGAFVHPGFYALSGCVGAGLFMAGLTGWCGLALLLAKAPWNK